ncbi:MAG: hypothetical protein [Circoviridae sp.]|nr:MAG: hypothetical protein [Circoviridae sp.]
MGCWHVQRETVKYLPFHPATGRVDRLLSVFKRGVILYPLLKFLLLLRCIMISLFPAAVGKHGSRYLSQYCRVYGGSADQAGGQAAERP